jgi:hypothetical protein
MSKDDGWLYSGRMSQTDPLPARLKLMHYPQPASLDEAVWTAILLVRVSAPHHALFEESLNGLGRVDRPF